MHCPLCIDTDLDPTFRSGIEIDRCPTCKGIWLDRGELDKLLGDAPTRSRVDRHVRPDQHRYEDTRQVVRHDYSREHAYDHRPSKQSKKKQKKKSKGQLLADLLDDVLDL